MVLKTRNSIEKGVRACVRARVCVCVHACVCVRQCLSVSRTAASFMGCEEEVLPLVVSPEADQFTSYNNRMELFEVRSVSEWNSLSPGGN